MLSLFLFICVAISSVQPAAFISDQTPMPGHEEECYDNSGTEFYRRGEIFRKREGECVQRKCAGVVEETGKVRTEIITCPTVGAGFGCTIVEDLSKPFPQCCPQLVAMPSIEPRFCAFMNGLSE